MNLSLAHQPVRLATAALLLAAASCGGGGGGASDGGGGTGNGYFIQLKYPATASDTGKPNTITSSQKKAFQAAATRIGKVITARLSGMSSTQFHGQTCKKSNSDPGYSIDVDVQNLLIFVEAVSIDGAGGVLGQSGPCFVRTSNSLPVVGIMQFDSADLAALETNGMLDEVILHEMLHVVGFGTIWTDKNGLLVGALTSGQDPTTAHTPTFTGAAAVTALHDVGGSSYPAVPVEGCSTAGTPAGCGAGTTDSHWTETVFQSELMTGWINGGANPLSKVTIGSLADLGYQVDMSQSDAYTLPGATLGAERAVTDVQRMHLGQDTLARPPTAVSDE